MKPLHLRLSHPLPYRVSTFSAIKSSSTSWLIFRLKSRRHSHGSHSDQEQPPSLLASNWLLLHSDQSSQAKQSQSSPLEEGAPARNPPGCGVLQPLQPLMVIKTHLTRQVFRLEAAFDHSGLCYKDNEFIFNVSNIVYRKFFQYFNKVDLFYRGYLKPVFKLLMTVISA